MIRRGVAAGTAFVADAAISAPDAAASQSSQTPFTSA